MKKLSALFVILSFLLAFNSNSFSQPKFTVNLIGGYSLPLPDLKGDFPSTLGGFVDTSFTTDVTKTYLIKNGFNFGAVGKYAFGKKGNVRLTGGANVNIFNQKKDYTESGVTATVDNKMNIINAFLGVEYAFMPKRSPGKIVNPFVGLDLAANIFSGSYEVTSNDTNLAQAKTDLKSAARFGFAVGAGVDIAFSKNVGAVIGAKYNLANIVGKDYDSTSVSTTEYQLADKEHTIGSHTFDARNISFIQFYAGVSFYLGQPKKKMSK